MILVRGPDAGKGYMPAIDGLRALAVIVILLFHFNIGPFKGGFVGVDVFFVISGFLITGIVLGQLRAGRFSPLAFYERRLRRIQPALLLVVAACALASPMIVLPTDLRDIGTGLYAAVTFTSNILFYTEANDYFAAGNLNLQPMLHTWSLSVEAQFYVLYPWLLIVLFRRRITIAGALAIVAALSFAASLWAVDHAPSAAFYFLPPRGWELLLGGVLAAMPPAGVGAHPPRRMMEALGLAMIAGPALLYTAEMPFPGLAATLPCAGALLLIGAALAAEGRPGPVGWLLVSGPAVFVGRMSYSLYLWHWPILVLAGYGRADPLTLADRLGLMALSFVPALLSWHYVESPINERRALATPRPFLAAVVIGSVFLATAGVVIDHAGRGEFPIRLLAPDVLKLASGQFDWVGGDCWPGDIGTPKKPCRFGSPETAPTVILWGNSYARMWIPGLDAEARMLGRAGVALHRTRCLPLPAETAGEPSDCQTFNTAVLDYIQAHPALTTVVLGANWFVAGPRLATLGATIVALRAMGRRVVLLQTPPQAPYPVPRTLAMAALRRQPPPPPIEEAAARAALKDSTDIIDDLRQTYDFTIVDPASFLCDGTSCHVEHDGSALYYDEGHVTAYAARLGRGIFAPIFDAR